MTSTSASQRPSTGSSGWRRSTSMSFDKPTMLEIVAEAMRRSKPNQAVSVRSPAAAQAMFGRMDGWTGPYGMLYLNGNARSLPVTYDPTLQPFQFVIVEGDGVDH